MTSDASAFPDRRDERIRVGELTFHVTDWGGHTSEDCIFLSHPTGFLGAVWKPLLARLRRLGVTSRLVTYDQRGHGLSSKPDDEYSWELFITDTIGVMKELGIRDALGIGHSAGAILLGTTTHTEGVMLSQTAISMATGASINGRLLSQTAVSLDSSTVVQPAP